MSKRNPLYLMVKPPLPIALEIQGLPETDLRRGVELLHCTMQPLGVCLDQTLKAIIEAFDRAAIEPFRLVFDRLTVGGGARLISSERLYGVEQFRNALVRVLANAGVIIRPYRSRPHITLSYRETIRVHTQAIDPISWKVEEIILVESIHGKTHHEHLERWQLKKPSD